jgi:hypothetical protein
MWVRFAFFALGYVMGTKAGRERYHQLVALARWAAGRDEVRTGLSLVQSAIQVVLEREELQARRRAA